ncbi:hypothetical protein AK812_SmicGene34959 [Symbiodinium microadriaticum]|uniref:Uncharacterized protein n=1 Tax=Symbiodinium microadriaticum TaxID=2951 RepID=A0A1Q9CMQ4_SYMMI|nr:hypothetical protein AK812_SmicGene34959 [Symbiodinium microadriaticum]CAE7345337.1 unnamed protein product [Symbiodinium sp. KB8]CAE7810844.1 unnamed protein product [Symbiodinium microadriaticum]
MKGASKGHGPQPVQQRRLISTKRVHGQVLDWHGNFGWIQALQPVEHPEAHRNQGRIYMAGEDVQEDLSGVGADVTFFLYQDANGLGAMNVRPAPNTSRLTAPPTHKGGYGRATGGAGRLQWNTSANQPKAKTPRLTPKGYGGGYAPLTRGTVEPHDKVLERVHTALHKSVNKATKKIADQEKDWDQVELCKRIVRYLYKGAQAPELLTLHWHQAAEQFVDTAMQGFTAACGDKPWFFEMDLTSAFGMAFWEIHSGSGQRAQWSEVEAVLNSKYEQLMDLCLLEKAMWDSAGSLIPDQEPVRNKLYKALKTSHEIAFKEATEAPRMGDLQRVELFTRAWVDTAMNKSYSVLEQAEGNLMNADSVVQLFQELLAPFGEEHPFSCIPAVLTQSIGRPPKDWDFLQETVRQFFLLWNNPDNGADAGYGQRRTFKRPYDAFSSPGRPTKGKGRGMQAASRSIRTGEVHAGPDMAAPPLLAIDAFCTHAADAKAKAPLRHVLIRDLAKVAAALKQPLATKEAAALLQAFDGEPGAAELCAKQMHLKLLRRLAKASSTAEISKAMQGAVLDLDAELRQQRPGVPGCSGVIALFVGCCLYVVVAGSCVGNIWGKGLSELAFAPAVSEIGKDGVLRKSSKESPEQKRAKALLRLKARNPHQQIGGSVSLPGGRRPGSEAVAARGAAAIRASAAVAMGKGETALSAEAGLPSDAAPCQDLLTEVVDLRAGDHTSILLGSSGLANSGLTPQDIGTLAEACEDATKASMTIAELAKERLKEAVKGEANWVQQEKAKASEVTCLAVKLDWEPAGRDTDEPDAKRLRLSHDA